MKATIHQQLITLIIVLFLYPTSINAQIKEYPSKELIKEIHQVDISNYSLIQVSELSNNQLELMQRNSGVIIFKSNYFDLYFQLYCNRVRKIQCVE